MSPDECEEIGELAAMMHQALLASTYYCNHPETPQQVPIQAAPEQAAQLALSHAVALNKRLKEWHKMAATP